MLLVDQTLESLQDLNFWRALCPFLSIADTAIESEVRARTDTLEVIHSYASSPRDQVENLGLLLADRGFFRLPTGQMEIPSELLSNLAAGVHRLVAHGFHPTFLLMYDEVWLLGELIGSILIPASGNAPVGDWFVFHVDPSIVAGYQPGPPHRDRPLATESSFRGLTGSPKYCSAWLALTDATPENSCLYVIPRGNDDGYHGIGDATASAHTAARQFQGIVAQPLSAGGLLAFSHRLLHWGSTPQPNAVLESDAVGIVADRIALSLAFADPSFEEPYFDHSVHLPFPPVGLRLGLVAGQQIQYEHLAPLGKHEVALFRRIFHSQRAFFGDAYYDKISSAVQFLAFQKAQQRHKLTKQACSVSDRVDIAAVGRMAALAEEVKGRS